MPFSLYPYLPTELMETETKLTRRLLVILSSIAFAFTHFVVQYVLTSKLPDFFYSYVPLMPKSSQPITKVKDVKSAVLKILLYKYNL